MKNIYEMYRVTITTEIEERVSAGRAEARKVNASDTLDALRASVKARRDRGLRMCDLPCGHFSDADARKVERLIGELMGVCDELRLMATSALEQGELGWAKQLITVADYAIRSAYSLNFGLSRD